MRIGRNDSCMPLAPEHVPTVDKVNTYLERRAQGDICKDVLDCNSWGAEAFLMDDLARIVRHEEPHPNATLAETRLYLRAVSWFLYPAPSDQALLFMIDQNPLFSSSDRALFHGALVSHLQDEQIEPAVQRLETLYLHAWDNLKNACAQTHLAWRDLAKTDTPENIRSARQAVETLRPLRDALYFRRHLPSWLAWAGQTPK